MWSSWSSSSHDNSPTSYLKVYAGTSYNKETLQPVPVNKQQELHNVDHNHENIKISNNLESVEDNPQVVYLESEFIYAQVAVRIHDFQEISCDTSTDSLLQASDEGSKCSSKLKFSTSNSSYFDHILHKSDRLSIQITLAFKKSEFQAQGEDQEDQCIYGDDLVWGNDFDEPIRDFLPYGTGVGLEIMKRMVDPSVDGDMYCDTPYLYGSALTSFNKIEVREMECSGKQLIWPGIIEEDNLNQQEENEKVNEKIDEDALSSDIPNESNNENETAFESDSKNNISITDKPDTGDVISNSQKACVTPIPRNSLERSRYFLTQENRHSFIFKTTPTQYSFDFYTAYLDLGREFAISLPGFKFNVEKYGNGQPLRYTLKNRRSGDVYLVVVFELVKL